MASASPHTTRAPITNFLNGGVQANAGYVAGEPAIHGFGLTHLSGVGCPDFGAPVLAATVGPVPLEFDDYGSAYDSETAHAGYYSVHLGEHDIWAEMTATLHTGVFRFFFPMSETATLTVDTGKSLSWRQDEGAVRIVGAREIEGSVGLGNFCASGVRSRLYFVLRADRDADRSGVVQDGTRSDGTEADGSALAYLQFSTKRSDAIEVQVGVSWVSVEGARANLEAESMAFEPAHADAVADWQTVLGKVVVEGGSGDDRTRFYTALYHSLLHPNIASDVGGHYRKFGSADIGISSEQHYSVFSLWDTSRSLHPLLTLLYPERQSAMLRTMADMADSSGRPPLWELSGQEAAPMVGDPAAVVVADSLAKGLTDFDAEALYQVMKAAAEDEHHRPGIVAHRRLGYVPMEQRQSVWGPASTSLEYAVADGALATLADALGHGVDATGFAAQSLAYQHLYDPSTFTLRPRNEDGSFYAPFDPDAATGSAQFGRLGGPGYVEGTAWQYAFFAPHDMTGLIALHGESDFVDRLQWVFDTDRFVMWNEPDMAYPYLFTYVDGEWDRTQTQVVDARDTYFTTETSGIPGNDDAGAMSSWFVFSALGFYPVAAGTDDYQLGLPLFESVTLNLERPFVIERASVGNATMSMLDGSALASPSLSHAQITAGGTLRFQ